MQVVQAAAEVAVPPGLRDAIARYREAVELLGEARTVLTEMQAHLTREIDKVGQAQSVCMEALLSLGAGAPEADGHAKPANGNGNGHHPAPVVELRAEPVETGSMAEQVERADALLRRELAAGPRLSAGLRELAHLEGIGDRAFTAARKRLGVKTERRGFQGNGGVWAVLPETLPPPPKPKPKPFVYEVGASSKPTTEARMRARSAPLASPKRHDPSSYRYGEKRAAVLDALPGTVIEVAERTGLTTHAVGIQLTALMRQGLVHHPGRATVRNKRVYVYARTF